MWHPQKWGKTRGKQIRKSRLKESNTSQTTHSQCLVPISNRFTVTSGLGSRVFLSFKTTFSSYLILPATSKQSQFFSYTAAHPSVWCRNKTLKWCGIALNSSGFSKAGYLHSEPGHGQHEPACAPRTPHSPTRSAHSHNKSTPFDN